MSSTFVTAISRIKEHLKVKGLTIILDFDEVSSLAKMDSMFSYDKKSKILTIVAPKLADSDKELLFEIIRKVHEEDGLIWKQNKDDILTSYSSYNSSKVEADIKILKFFDGVLIKADFDALKMSLYLRSQASQGKNISSYKMDIRDRFGDRGVNIANLCSAGYFEDEFIPLYNERTPEEFKEYYEMVVGAKARALFVHSKMNVSDIETEVNVMVSKAIKYHMTDFRIHGKGANNVSNIKEFISSISIDDGYFIKKIFDEPKLPAVAYSVEFVRE